MPYEVLHALPDHQIEPAELSDSDLDQISAGLLRAPVRRAAWGVGRLAVRSAFYARPFWGWGWGWGGGWGWGWW